MTVEFRAAREDEWQACLDLWTTTFPHTPRGYFERYFYGDEEFTPDFATVAVEEGRIVSAVQVVKRVVACGDCSLTIGGIANVGTLPEYRRRGLSEACLRRAIDVMRGDAMDFSLLFTGVPAHYARFGWEVVPRSFLAGALRAEIPPAFPGVTVRDATEGDAEAIRGAYEAFNATRPLAVRRSPSYWRNWVGWSLRHEPLRVRVAMRGDAVAGYCMTWRHDGQAAVWEIAAEGDEDTVAFALLRDAALEAQGRAIRSFQFRCAQSVSVRHAAVLLLESLKVEREDHAMFRLLDREALLRGLLPELTGRWLAAGAPAGDLRFATADGVVAIRAEAGRLHVESVDEAPGALSQADLVRLVIGAGASVPADAETFAAALFPPFDAWFWELDGF